MKSSEKTAVAVRHKLFISVDTDRSSSSKQAFPADRQSHFLLCLLLPRKTHVMAPVLWLC